MAQTWLWIATLAMAVGGAAILAIGGRRTPGEEAHTVIHGIVPIIAACAYFAMVTGQGVVSLPDGAGTRNFYFARYIDWSFTTPLLLLALSMTAMHSGLRRMGAVLGLLLADLMMIVTGFFFAAATVPWVKATWFIVSCGAFLAVFYCLRTPLAEEARKEPSLADYQRNAHILGALWLLYPIIVGLSPDGVGWLGEGVSVALVAIVDIVSKVGFGLWATKTTAKLTDQSVAQTVRVA